MGVLTMEGNRMAWLIPLLMVMLTPSPPTFAVSSSPSIPSPLSTPTSPKPSPADQLLQQGNQQYQNRQFEAAIKSWQQARSLYQQQQNRQGEGSALVGLGAAYLSLERYRDAATTLESLLPLTQQLNNQRMEAETLGNLGIAYRVLGNYGRAIEVNRLAGKIMRAIGDRQGLSKILVNLGHVFAEVGDYDSAILASQQGLKIAQQSGDLAGESIAQSNLGGIYANSGKNDEAIVAFERSLAIAKTNRDLLGQASTLINLGSVYHALGQREKATQYYNESLTLARQVNHREREAEALGSLALAYEDLRDYNQSIQLYQKSLKIARALENTQLEGITLNNLGHAFFSAGRLAEAEQQLRAAIKLLDNLRPELSDIYKVSIFDTQIHTYNLLQQVLIAANKPEAALEVTEQGRARAFVELLARRLNSNQPLSSSRHFSQKHSIFAAPSVGQIKQIAQQQQATLVEYAIVPDDEFKFRGKQRARESELLIWVVQPTGQIAFRRVDLKPLWKNELTLSRLVTASRCLTNNRACRSLVRSIGRSSNGTESPSPINQRTSKQIEASSISTYTDQARTKNSALQKLHEILVEPIADLLPTDPNARVVFIQQESLFLVPFAALQNKDGKYLVEQHTLLTAPAIQILQLTHQQKLKRQQSEVPRKAGNPEQRRSALIVGNPTMPKISLEPGSSPKQLDPLPAAAQEAIEIAQLLNTNAITGNQASKSYIKQELPRAKLVHLATHGLLEYGSQKLSHDIGVPGAIALAPSNQDDGILTASEILEMELAAELVVLSACDTGQGKITGDGVVGLSRAFISAGTPSILVSLWSVPDAPTAQLMVAFYKHLQQKPDKAVALRQAMLETLQHHPNPLNWAAFTLIGEAE